MTLQAAKSMSRDMSEPDLTLRSQSSGLGSSSLPGERFMEGWLFRFGRHSYGKSYLHKRYFTLEGRVLAYYKHRPNGKEVPVRSLLIESDTRVDDRGLEKHRGHRLYAITICNKGERSKPITLGAASPEEAHVWKEAVEKVCSMGLGSLSFRLPRNFQVESLGAAENSDCETSESAEHLHQMKEVKPPTSVTRRVKSIGPGGTPKQIVDWVVEDKVLMVPEHDRHWELIKCENGLRFFEELQDAELELRVTPAIKSVGVVEASSDQIFSVMMALDGSRYEWDSLFEEATVVEHLDGHTDVIHQKLVCSWFSSFVWPRDLCYTRYWRRKDDGTYEILYNSVEHAKCPPTPGYVRAQINCAGYVITPLKGGGGMRPPARSRVEHVLSLDAKGWLGGWLYQKHIVEGMLNRVAGLRDLFASTPGHLRPAPYMAHGVIARSSACTATSQGRGSPTMSPLARFIARPKHSSSSRAKASESDNGEEVVVTPVSKDGSSSDDEDDVRLMENGDEGLGYASSVLSAPATPSASSLDLKADEKQAEAVVVNREDFEGNFPMGDLDKGKNCWGEPGGCHFRVRGKNFMRDRVKVQAGKPFCKLVAVDWFKARRRIDHIARKRGGVVEQAKGQHKFIIAVNMQVPGATHYSMVFYFVPQAVIKPGSLIHRYIHGDDQFRNSRMKLIPAVPKGNWIVKQSVGTIPCILGRALDCTYHQTPDYLEIDVDIGSSVVADGILRLVFGYVACLVVDMGFLVQGMTAEELPEQLLGSVRISKMELESAVALDPETLEAVGAS